jgi:hypothetical protein
MEACTSAGAYNFVEDGVGIGGVFVSVEGLVVVVEGLVIVEGVVVIVEELVVIVEELVVIVEEVVVFVELVGIVKQLVVVVEVVDVVDTVEVVLEGANETEAVVDKEVVLDWEEELDVVGMIVVEVLEEVLQEGWCHCCPTLDILLLRQNTFHNPLLAFALRKRINKMW